MLELAVLANFCTYGRRLLVILLPSPQQQLCSTDDVTSHYITGMECAHGRNCRDPEPSCSVLTVHSSQETTRTPLKPSNKSPGWHTVNEAEELREYQREDLVEEVDEPDKNILDVGAQAQDDGVTRISIVSIQLP